MDGLFFTCQVPPLGIIHNVKVKSFKKALNLKKVCALIWKVLNPF